MPDYVSTVEHNYSIRWKTVKKTVFGFPVRLAKINTEFCVCFLYRYITGSGNSPHFKVKSMLSIIRSVCSASWENGIQFSFAVRVGLFKMSWFNITPPIALYADLV